MKPNPSPGPRPCTDQPPVTQQVRSLRRPCVREDRLRRRPVPTMVLPREIIDASL